MSQFALLAALLALLAVGFATCALWKHSRGLALVLALGLPVVAAGLYRLEGNPAALDPAVVATPTTLEEAVAQLEKRLDAEPDNLEGQVLLARSYMAMQQFALARDRYARASRLRPDDGDLAMEYAEAMLRAAPDRRFPPEAIALIDKALAKDPRNQRALFYLGTHQMQQGEPAKAAATWASLLPLLDPGTAASLRRQVDAARETAGLPALPPETPAAVVAGPGTIDVTIDVAPALAGAVKPGEVLFVFAQPLDGAGPPFAARRIELSTLPMRIQLSDADSPMPAARLSTQSSVRLMARLSRSGDVKAASGDLEARPLTVSTDGNKPVSLLLEVRVP